MKTLSKIFLLLLFLYPPNWAQCQIQGISSVNNWRNVKDGSLIDSSMVKSFFYSNHLSQVFTSYGKTSYPTYWNLQTTWAKDFSIFTTPDTVFLDCKFLSGTNVEKIKAINVFIAIQNPNHYFFDGRFTQYNNISLNSSWKTLHWDMKLAKDYGMNFFTKFYVAFQIVTQDSCYIGAEVVVDNLRGYYNDSKKTIIYDTFGDITRVSDLEIPTGFVLFQNYPNPFNPSTKIKFSIPESGNYTLKVYNLLGQEIETLIDAYLAPGIQEYSFDGANLPSGTYFYRLTGNGISLSNKMMLIK